jgi:uncharacterized repeat protein (TIGR01451 family)
MDGKKIVQRVLSATLIAVMMINYCDTGLLRQVVSAFTIEDGMIRSATIDAKTQWEKKMSSVGVKKSGTGYAQIQATVANGGFWVDTSGLAVKWLNVYDETENKTGKVYATQYDSSSAGQRIAYLKDDNGSEVPILSNDITADTALSKGILYDKGTSVAKNAYAGSGDSSNLYYTIEADPAYDTEGYTTEVTAETSVENTDSTDADSSEVDDSADVEVITVPAKSAYYRRYYVSTAKQLSQILSFYNKNDSGSKFDDALKTSAKEINEVTGIAEDFVTPADKVGIVLLCDIDLGGLNGKKWTAYSNTDKYLEIDGNSHTIYNGYNGIFLNQDRYFAIHNVTFSHYFIGSGGGMFGTGDSGDSPTKNTHIYFSDVNWEGCVAIGGTGSGSYTALVFGSNSMYCYFKNCTIRDSYVVGRSKGHSGMFSSFNGDVPMDKTTIKKVVTETRTYIGNDSEENKDSKRYYITVPELENAERAWQGKTIYDGDGTEKYTLSTKYPTIYENCAAVDGAVYEVGSSTPAHSGTFVSCVRSMTIFRNCFSNCSIYGNQQLGGFIGAVIGSQVGGNYPDPDTGNSQLTNMVFENCYSSGVVEGTEKLGGFVGMVFNDQRATNDGKLGLSQWYSGTSYTSQKGKVIFKNCYSTASVGMASSAEYVGGFVGVLRGDKNAGDVEDRKHRFINCYAAGEVGGVSNSLDTSVYNTETVGGFVGSYCPEDYISNSEKIDKNQVNTDTARTQTWMAGKYQWLYDAENNKSGIEGPKSTVNDTAESDDKLKGIFTNCYYDMQTTAMREREVGAYPGYTVGKTEDTSKTTGYYYKLTETLDGITGVYTQKSILKDVKGLTDTDGIMDKGTPNETSAWTYVQGYYPQLKAFTEATVDELGSEQKVLNASLYSQASAATVFLDHYDDVLDYTKGIDGKTQGDKEVYDTVRDITSDFTFTSDGNSEDMQTDSGVTTNLGWRINTERNDSSSYHDILGGDNGFNASFNSSGTEITDKNYNPAVLMLTPEKDDDTGKYIFNCYEFSVGKQYVEVVTCLDDNYNTWANLQTRYDEYAKQLAQFEANKTNYINILGLDTDAKDEDVKAEVLAKIASLINLDGATEDAKVAEKLNAALDYGKRAEELSDTEMAAAKELYVWNDNYEGYTDAQILEKLYNDLSQFAVYPLNRPEESNEVVNWQSQDFADYAEANDSAVGRRTFRLIPSAYIDAGDMINIKVNQATDGTVTNDIRLGDEQLKRFDHTLGVIYVSTQDVPLWNKNLSTNTDFTNEVLNTRLVDYNYDYTDSSGTTTTTTSHFYTGTTDEDGSRKQVVVDRDTLEGENAKYYSEGKFNKASLNEDDVFALYSHYPGYGIDAQTAEQSDEDYKAAIKTQAETGFTDMVDEVSLGGFYPQDIQQDYTNANAMVGRTQVRVYRASISKHYYDVNGNPVKKEDYDKNTGSVKMTLQKADEVKMSEGDNLAKWSGLANFEVEDSDYYYMTYYWRLTDGRYISADKLVHIDSNSYTVDMITGVADATGDSFHNGTVGEYTDIDCDVTLDDVEDWEEYQFPSDKYNAEDGEWTDYATGAYNYNYDFTYPETEEDYATDTNYWAKGVELKTGLDGVTVAWRKNADYSLAKLIIMVRKNEDGVAGSWLPMTVAKFDDKGEATLDESTIVYSYTYNSMKVTQDPSTKLFSVTETENTVKRFEVVGKEGLENATVKYIQFKFVDTGDGSESNVKLTDDIKVVALFKTVAADVNVEKYALIDDGKGAVLNKADGKGAYLPLYKADAYRNIDNLSLGDDEQRAILFGDTIIYRMKVHNDGIYNANNVIVKDDIPDGCTLVDDSIAIYKQKKTYDRLGTEDGDSYDKLEKVAAEEKTIDDDMANDYENAHSYWQIGKDADGVPERITWILNPVRMDYDYYVQYEVKVDGNYNKFKEVVNDSLKELVNKADYTYVYINGDLYTTDTTDNPRGSCNEDYAKNAVFNVTSNEKDGDDGEYNYTINFNEQNANTKSYVQSVTNELPLGYKLNGDVNVEISRGDTVSNASVTTTIENGGTSFTIKPTAGTQLYFGTDTDGGKMNIKVTFTAVKDEAYSEDIPERRENESIISFSKVLDGTTDEKSNVMKSTITKVDAPTNEVQSAVRWLYLNVEKEISEQDDRQTFLFKLVNTDDNNSALLTDITTSLKSDANGTKYVGNSLIEITKRGSYVVNETDWSDTDYDPTKTEYSAEDISVETGSEAVSSEDTPDYMGDISCQNSAEGVDGYASVYLPRYMYKSTAFPLWAVENSAGETIYPTVTCKNTPSEYAWLSAQQSVENSFTLPTADTTGSDSTPTTLFTVARAKAATRKQAEDDVTTPSAIITSGIELKNEDDDAEEE